MEKGEISPKQRQILEYVKSQIVLRGYPPSVRDICAAVNLKSTSSVHAHLEKLEANGYIRRDPAKPRAIEILDDEFRRAGREDFCIPVPESISVHSSAFYFQATDDSLSDVGIFAQDYVLFARQDTARDGDIILTRVNGRSVLEIFHGETSMHILGKAIGVFHFF